MCRAAWYSMSNVMRFIATLQIAIVRVTLEV